MVVTQSDLVGQVGLLVSGNSRSDCRPCCDSPLSPTAAAARAQPPDSPPGPELQRGMPGIPPEADATGVARRFTLPGQQYYSPHRGFTLLNRPSPSSAVPRGALTQGVPEKPHTGSTESR
ncbi:hypothetical protein SKAU_G00035970 [Synaphobranchus kaupii]|uniref:Uncharacterized protein n=1 Tax=Synaphobranchus kaupii TaxID=118154 RepID=A0A9Q1GES1_SYNKA|nr:hypothetical protein SKAU_G00035970 [Synaphobranchus kaupii]